MKQSSSFNDSENIREPEGFSRRNIFQAPEGYFEKLPVQVADRISTRTVIDKPYRRPVRILAASALVIILISAGWFYRDHSNRPKRQVADTTISYDELVGSGMVYEFDESMLVEVYHAEAGDARSSDGLTDDYESYLLNNNTDITLIINEL